MLCPCRRHLRDRRASAAASARQQCHRRATCPVEGWHQDGGGSGTTRHAERVLDSADDIASLCSLVIVTGRESCGDAGLAPGPAEVGLTPALAGAGGAIASPQANWPGGSPSGATSSRRIGRLPAPHPILGGRPATGREAHIRLSTARPGGAVGVMEPPRRDGRAGASLAAVSPRRRQVQAGGGERGREFPSMRNMRRPAPNIAGTR